MELIYIWINEYRTFKKTDINLSDKFIVKYNQESNSISIEENKDYFKLYQDHILNISALLGKNSTGKSNLLDLMGMKIDDRNNLKEEIEIVYKRKKPGQIGYKVPEDIEEIKKKSRYFFLYYLGKNEKEIDKFCIEGNDIDSYIDLFSNKSIIDTQQKHNPINYWQNKYWFAFLCTYKGEKLIYERDVQEDGGMDVEHKKHCPTTKNKVAYILFRENYNQNYYEHNSFKSEDDYKIAIPRRIAYYDTKYLYKKIEFLIDQIQRKDKVIYSNNSYNLSIRYNKSYKTKDVDICDIEEIENDLSDNEKSVCKILSSFCFFFATSIFPTEEKGTKEEREYFSNVNMKVSQIKPIGKSYQNIKDYYGDVLKYIVNAFFLKDRETNAEDDINHFINSYYNLETVLEKVFINMGNKSNKIKMIRDNIDIIIDKNSNKQLISELIHATIDEEIDSNMEGTYSVFMNFFDYTIKFLSDGELAYLGMMASLDEQISLLTQVKNSVEKKEKYILLLDEPESRMHPELARTFIKTLIDFLSQYKDKTFQIILASHSPFLVSDISKTNIFTITKEEGSLSVLKPCELDTFGQNIHTLLKNAFFMNFTMGEYARNMIEEVKIFLDCKIENVYYDGEMTIDEAEKIINLIGESVLKTALQRKLKRIKSNYITSELKDTINKYDKLSADDKKRLIEHIIVSQKGGYQR